MAQHDQQLDNGPGRAVRLDMNAAIAALFSSSSGPVAPEVTVGGQPWFDTGDPAAPKLWYRDAANTNWMDINRDFETAQYQGSPGDFTITPANLGDFIQFTSPGTANLPPVASVTNRFWANISAQNGAVLIQPRPGETIDGQATLTVPIGFSVQLRATGTDWRTSMVPITNATMKAFFGTLPTVTPTVGDTVLIIQADGSLGKADNAQLGSPIGAIITHGAATAPANHLACNGALVSRTTYSRLFGVIGTAWGAGDGSTTFALPDLRGEFLRGFDAGRGADPSRVFGSFQSHAFASHNHSVSDPQHYHVILGGVGTSGQGYSQNGVGTNTLNVNTNYAYTGISIVANGSNETRARNKAVLFAIKY